MPWSMTIGRFGGTAVKIHVTFLLLLAWIGFSAWQRGGPQAAADSLVFIVALFACVVLHEFGHVLTARSFGIATSEVTLLPIGGVASLQRMPTDPVQELLVALAGPAVNLVLALGLALALGSMQLGALTHIDDPSASLLGRLAAANLFLAVFNLIPAFPMDGGRVLHALLAMKVGASRATGLSARIGQALAFVFGFLGLFGNPMLLFIAIFVYIAAAGEAQLDALHQALQDLVAGDVMETEVATLSIDAALSDAVDALMASPQKEFPVIDAFRKPIGIFSREEIRAALARSAGGDAPASNFLQSSVATVSASTPAERALEALQDPKAQALCVVDGDGALIGLLDRQTLSEAMLIRSIRPDWRFQRARSRAG